MNKERLQDIKKKYNYERLGEFIDVKPVNPYELRWLIEQAERVQELGEEVKRYQSGRNVAVITKMKMDELEQQNKRYREALSIISANLPLDEREHYVDIARQALEGHE